MVTLRGDSLLLPRPCTKIAHVKGPGPCGNDRRDARRTASRVTVISPVRVPEPALLAIAPGLLSELPSSLPASFRLLTTADSGSGPHDLSLWVRLHLRAAVSGELCFTAWRRSDVQASPPGFGVEGGVVSDDKDARKRLLALLD